MSCQNPKIHVNHRPILDRGEASYSEIRIKKWECQKYLLYPEEAWVYERRFFVEAWAIFRGAGIALWADIHLKMSIFIEWSDAEGSLMILGLVQSQRKITLDWVGDVLSGCEEVKLRIDQTSILLGDDALVKGRPVLRVATDSIEGGHSCRIHRISGEALFYLESHGIDSTTAEGMLIEAEIHRCTDLLEERGEAVKEEIREKLKK